MSDQCELLLKGNEHYVTSVKKMSIQGQHVDMSKTGCIMEIITQLVCNIGLALS